MANTDLRVRISADLADIKQGLGLLRGELAKVKAQTAGAFSAGSSNAFVGSLRRLRAEVVGLAGAYASLAGGKMLAGVADEATRLRGRIREAKGDYQSILALAQSTRTGLSATADLYARLERSTRGQIDSQAELLGLTKSVNQAIKLSYTGTAQGEAAVLQLGQALASGKLAGDEFRSISENAPRLMQAIADGVGKPIGALKDLAKEGKLTSDVVVNALQSQADVLQEEYTRVPLTIGDAFVQIRNSFVEFIGTADEANGASRAFAEALQGVARNLPALLTPLLQILQALIKHFDVLAVFIGTRMALSAIPAMIAGVARLQAAFVALRGATLAWSAVMAGLGGPIGLALAALATALYVVYQRTNDAKRAAEEHRKALADNAQTATVSAEAALKEAQAKRIQAAATLQAARAALEEKRARFALQNQSVTARGGDRGDAAALASTNALNRQRQEVAQAEKQYKDWGDRLAELAVQMQMPLEAPAATIGKIDVQLGETGKKLKSTADKAKEAVRGVVDEMALSQDAVERQLDALEQRFQDGQIVVADYFQQRVALELQAIDIKIAEAQADALAATSSEQQSRALTEIVKLQRDRLEVGQRAAREQAKAEREAAKATQETLDAEYSRIGTNLRSETDYINAQAQLGAIGPVEAERQLQAVRAASIEQYQKLLKGQQDYLDSMSPEDPRFQAAHEALRRTQTELAQVQSAQQKFANTVKEGATTALTNFFTDLASGAKSFKDAFKDMVLSFVQGLARMAAEALAQQAIQSLFKALGGGFSSGGAFGASGRMFAKGAAFALPGIMAFANGGAFTNSIVDSPQLFAFGKGGQFGVMGEAGPEAVMPLTRGPGGRLGVDASGGGRSRGVRVVVVDDKRSASDYLNNPGFEEAVLVSLGNNPGRAKEVLG